MFSNLFGEWDVVKLLEFGTRLLIIFMVLPIHEYAHAWAANKLGDKTAYYQGRMTLNPLAHIDPLGALCLFVAGFGWAKPVPVNPLKFKKQRSGMAICAAAGPISNLIIAFLGMIVYRVVILLNNGSEAMFYFSYIVYFFVSINIGLALFNLIPIPPLDGSKILSYFTSADFDRKIEQYQTYIYIGFIFIMFTGILSRPLGFLSDGIFQLFYFLTGWVNNVVGLFM